MKGEAEVCILGASGHAKVIASCLLAAGSSVRAFYDDDSAKGGQRLLGIEVAGALADCAVSDSEAAIVGIGENRTRRRVVEMRVGQLWGRAIHPRAWIAADAAIGMGTVVFAGAIVQPGARIGRHCILNTGCSVDHDCVLEDFTHLAPGVHLAGDVRIGEGAFLGVGVSVIPGVSIGRWAIVGAGAVVTRDVKEGNTVVGVPARARSSHGDGP